MKSEPIIGAQRFWASSDPRNCTICGKPIPRATGEHVCGCGRVEELERLKAEVAEWRRRLLVAWEKDERPVITALLEMGPYWKWATR